MKVGQMAPPELMPNDPKKKEARRQEVREGFAKRNASLADHFRTKLGESYGKERGDKVKHAEAFELCEYGVNRMRKN
jgi:hypothetical protein